MLEHITTLGWVYAAGFVVSSIVSVWWLFADGPPSTFGGWVSAVLQAIGIALAMLMWPVWAIVLIVAGALHLMTERL